MDSQTPSGQLPNYFKVVILADVVNDLPTIAEALLDSLPCYDKRKGEYLERDRNYAMKMPEIANSYGWYVVFESKNETEAFRVQQSLQYRGIRLLPFCYSLPSPPIQSVDFDFTQETEPRIDQVRSKS